MASFVLFALVLVVSRPSSSSSSSRGRAVAFVVESPPGLRRHHRRFFKGPESAVTSSDLVLLGVSELPHATLDRAYFIEKEEILIGVPKAEWIPSMSCPKFFVITDRVEDKGSTQLKWIDAFPETRRIVHRFDAGRGKLRRDSDWLLSTGDDFLGRAKMDMTPRDVDVEIERIRDDGPWQLTEDLTAHWTPGPTQGSCVLQYKDVLFTGRLCGAKNGTLLPFAHECDHDVRDHVASLNAIADLEFTWILPARGDPIHFNSTTEARDALRHAADIASNLVSSSQQGF